mgnify:CR=1 FL=1
MKKTITIPKEDFEKIKEFCDREDMKISAVFRKGAKILIENDKMQL